MPRKKAEPVVEEEVVETVEETPPEPEPPVDPMEKLHFLGDARDKSHEKINMLVYARSGAGKTYWASSAPAPFFMACDPRGFDSVPKKRYWKDGKLPGKIVYTLSDILEVIEWFEGGEHVAHGIKTLVVDGLNFIHDMYLTEIGEYMVETMGAKDPDLMPISGQMKILRSYKRLLNRLINLTSLYPEKNRVHVIFTTLEESMKEDELAPYVLRPNLGTKTNNERFPPMFSVIAYITPVGEDENGELTQERKVLMTEYRGIMARDRLGIFPLMGKAPDLSEYLK